MTGTAPQPGAAGPPKGGSGRDRYLVGADDPALLHRLADRLRAGGGSGVTLLRATGSVLVVEGGADAVEQLRRAGNGRLFIEPDGALAEPAPVTPDRHP
jgi:hypothetical protein